MTWTPWPAEALDDVRIEAVTDGARLIFYGMLALASHRGRCAGDARGLTRALRLTNVAPVERALRELERAGIVERYESAGVRVAAIARYSDYGLPDNRRFDSKLSDVAADRYPPPTGIVEKGWGETAEQPQSNRRATAEEAKTAESKKTAEREIHSSLSLACPEPPAPAPAPATATANPSTASNSSNRPAPAKAAGRSLKAAPREQLQLGAPVEAPVVVPEAIRAAVERWEAHAERLRGAGVRVPVVARADLVELADGVAPELFAEAVRHHVEESAPCYWRSPLALLALRVQWQHDKRVQVRPPARAAPASRGDVSPAPSARPARPPLVTVPDDEWAADWSSALERLRLVVEPWDVSHWLDPLDGLGVTLDGVPVLRAPDESHSHWVEEQFAALIEHTLGYRPIFDTYPDRPTRTIQPDLQVGASHAQA